MKLLLMMMVLVMVKLLGEDGKSMDMLVKMTLLHQKRVLELPLETVLEPFLKLVVVVLLNSPLWLAFENLGMHCGSHC